MNSIHQETSWNANMHPDRTRNEITLVKRLEYFNWTGPADTTCMRPITRCTLVCDSCMA